MIRYAKLNNNVVENIIISNEEDVTNMDGDFILVSTETNDPVVGYEYNSEKNKFTSPQPYESWILNEETLTWESPAGSKPTDGFYRWDEESLSWKQLGQE